MKRNVPELRAGSLLYDTNEAGDESGLKCEDESLTLQSQSQDADINVIMKKFGVTGMLPQSGRIPTYGDFTGVSDYRTALHALRDADAAFMALPANIRSRFDNDPAQFVDFCSDPANLDELVSMGLAVKREVQDGEEGRSDESDSRSARRGDRHDSEPESRGEPGGGEGRFGGSESQRSRARGSRDSS